MGRCSRRGLSRLIRQTMFSSPIKTIAFRNLIQAVSSSLSLLREAAAPGQSLRHPGSQLIEQRAIYMYLMDFQNERVG